MLCVFVFYSAWAASEYVIIITHCFRRYNYNNAEFHDLLISLEFIFENSGAKNTGSVFLPAAVNLLLQVRVLSWTIKIACKKMVFLAWKQHDLWQRLVNDIAGQCLRMILFFDVCICRDACMSKCTCVRVWVCGCVGVWVCGRGACVHACVRVCMCLLQPWFLTIG